MAKKMKALEMKKELLVGIVRKGMPVLGNLSSAYLPCGKANCKCQEGFLHGPAWRLTWKDQKQKTAILYVPKKKIAQVAKAIADYQKARGALREIGLYNLSRLAQEVKRK